MPVLSLQPCKGKGLNWPFLRFLGAFSDCSVGFPQWRSLAETLGRSAVTILGLEGFYKTSISFKASIA